MKEVRNQFTFYRSYFDAIQNLNKKDRSAIILAVCEYALYETEPKGLSATAIAAFELIRPTLDSGRKKASSGKQGGKANRKQTASKDEANGKQTESKDEANPKRGQNAREYDVDVDVDVDVDAESKGNASPLLALGDGKNVFLKEDEYAALIRQMGQRAFDRYVDKLSDFITRTGAKVYDHYATIIRWWEEDSMKPNKPSKQDQYQHHDGELSDLERKAIQAALQEGEE